MNRKKITTENTNQKFIIDFFELAFLTEACLPPSTIARHSFFMNIIDIYYNQMSWEQRNHFFEWIGKKLNKEQEESQIFLARFNPDNQFNITTFYEGKKDIVHAFFMNGKYWISSRRNVNHNYIKSVEKIEF
jgi:hypothetical protein